MHPKRVLCRVLGVRSRVQVLGFTLTLTAGLAVAVALALAHCSCSALPLTLTRGTAQICYF